MEPAAPLALTIGDPNGIGAEIALKAWAALRGEPSMAFFLLADPAHLAQTAKRLALGTSLGRATPQSAADIFADALPVVPLLTGIGEDRESAAAAAIESIETAVALVRGGRAGAVVTNPIAKDRLYAAGFIHPGHTEFLGALALHHWGVAATPVMMLWSPELATVPVTVHIPLDRVPAALTIEAIVTKARIVAHDLRTRFGVATPRLALCGLNPHAGENGTMGSQDRAIVAPAVAQLRAEGIEATGPHPADTLFNPKARTTYDVALGMYHDQALIPIKTLAFDTAVNVTLGLPFIRTSPDHGTAFDIAGTGIADPSSLIAAISLAARLASVDAAR